MRREKKLKRLFGKNEHGFADLPKKVSGTTISRINQCKYWMMCSLCFPHGREVSNSKWFKDLRCWKRYRRFQSRRQDA